MELLQSDTVRKFLQSDLIQNKSLMLYLISLLIILLYCFQKNAVAMCSAESWVNDVTERKLYLPTDLMGKEVRQ